MATFHPTHGKHTGCQKMSAKGQDQRTDTPQAKRNLKVETGDPQSQRSCKVDSVRIDLENSSGGGCSWDDGETRGKKLGSVPGCLTPLNSI